MTWQQTAGWLTGSQTGVSGLSIGHWNATMVAVPSNSIGLLERELNHPASFHQQ
jgi:hypothetical protein